MSDCVYTIYSYIIYLATIYSALKEYDENLAASVYLENDLEMLGRMKDFMI